jgi:DNA repair and recombination protein RAD54B
MSRVWRDGQTRKVFIYRLVTVGTIEERIFQRQLNKKGLGGGILDSEKPGAAQQFHFSKG